LSNEEVGEYLNRFFVSSYQKVGTFRKTGNRKQGGNVAGYFCTPQGRVLHLVAGPVTPEMLLKEARWVIDTWKMVQWEGANLSLKGIQVLRKAHYDRFVEKEGHSASVQPLSAIPNLQSRVHLLLTLAPMPKIDQVYQLVFEKIVGEPVSTNPVMENQR
jgi:hypothetical protein